VTAVAIGALLAAALCAGLLVRARRDAAAARARLEGTQHALEDLQRAFARFTPAAVIEEVIARGVSRSAEKKEVTVLFRDLQEFTPMAESLDPGELVRILNGYFQRMSRVVTDARGHVAKFLGDGFMALFGALEPNPWQADDAVRAALGMREALVGYNRELAGRGQPQLRFGVGIHRGTVVAGVMGSPELMEFTVIGDAVNLAARVESLTRAVGADILITEAVRENLDPRFRLRALAPAQVKGKREPVTTWAVEGVDDAGMHRG
jgi:adenylate cyclase